MLLFQSSLILNICRKKQMHPDHLITVYKNDNKPTHEKNATIFLLVLMTFFPIWGLMAQSSDPTVNAIKPVQDSLTGSKDKDCQQGAIGDWFKKKDKAPKPVKKFMALVLPNVSSNPSNGFLLGVGGTFGWYMGPKENTRVSVLSLQPAHIRTWDQCPGYSQSAGWVSLGW